MSHNFHLHTLRYTTYKKETDQDSCINSVYSCPTTGTPSQSFVFRNMLFIEMGHSGSYSPSLWPPWVPTVRTSHCQCTNGGWYAITNVHVNAKRGHSTYEIRSERSTRFGGYYVFIMS